MSTTGPGPTGAPQVEGYDGLEQIGRGGFATVYRARQVGFDRVVALKVLEVPHADADAQQRFQRECRAIGALSWHPHIVVVHDSGVTADGRLFLAMEHLEGGSLADRVRSDGPMPWEAVVRAGIEVCGALETAHEAGTLHRDLKPDNVLVGIYGQAKLGDFGIAAVEGGPATSTGQAALTVLYAAPEVLRGERATVRSDVFSLASTLYTLLAGRAAFARAGDESVGATVLRAVTEEAPDLRPLGVPEDLAAVIEAGMAKDAAARPESAAALGRALQRVQQAHGLPVTDLRLDPRRAAQAGDERGDSAPTVLVGAEAVAAGAAAAGAAAGSDPAGVSAVTDPGSAPDLVPAPEGPSEPEGRPRWLLPLVAVAAVLLVGGLAWLVFGRSSGDDETASSSASTTTEAPSTTTSTTAATTSTAAAPTATTSGGVVATTSPPATVTPETSPFIATTPEEAAQGLLQAWTVGDSEGASLYAEQDVIAELFVNPTGGASSTFQGCSDNGDATFNCNLSYEGGATNFTVSAPPGGRFRVTAASSIAD